MRNLFLVDTYHDYKEKLVLASLGELLPTTALLGCKVLCMGLWIGDLRLTLTELVLLRNEACIIARVLLRKHLHFLRWYRILMLDQPAALSKIRMVNLCWSIRGVLRRLSVISAVLMIRRGGSAYARVM